MCCFSTSSFPLDLEAGAGPPAPDHPQAASSSTHRQLDRQPRQCTHHQHLDHTALEVEQGNSGGRGDKCGGPLESSPKAVGPEHVVTEEQRQIQDHTYHGGGDPGQRRCELQFVVRRLHQRTAGKDEQERGQEGEPGDQHSRHRARQERM